ncbi:flagellar hook-basal body complex protein [Alkalicaulis satelles]|uniref:Flagellar hook-basal body complex protein n=1 Tax=Alkalicaulis satelles TaxID=2609175 RepID=A0A5M6ZGG0_9PROT|nr:flagellar hook-basal body complex protein [Alkalicaulis satelles]KAA5803345.1 flagellar hook-basal body complex protein [Alkalicaulis satelles]
MDNAMLIGLSRQLTLRREMDITANNIANASTEGFKAERVLLEPREAARARHQDGPARVQFVGEWAMGRDFTQGVLTPTGRPLDLALDGPGYFVLDTPAGERFTRDGRFTLNAAGELTAADGARVLDEGGAPIVINRELGPVEISANGALSQGGIPGPRLALAAFEQPGLLSKTGDNRYQAPDDAERLDARPEVRQGFSEASNVRPILEMTRMMEVSRAYQSVTRMIRDADELSRKAIERLGRP